LTFPRPQDIVQCSITLSLLRNAQQLEGLAVMADSEGSKIEGSAEKAYAAAAEATVGKVVPQGPDGSEQGPVEFPDQIQRGRKASPKAAETLPAADAAPGKSRKPLANEAEALAETPPPKTPKAPLTAKRKDANMDMTASLKDAVSDAQDKAKEAFAKTGAFAGEYGEFAKGNVEALVESGKILASGLQGLSSAFLADGKSAIETMTSEVKELSAAKSPTDFFKLQTELFQRNLDSALAYGSKTSEAMLKLTNDVMAPISSRVSLAVEKARKAA
jgi:phasin family protein